jgi:hypothetical protein
MPSPTLLTYDYDPTGLNPTNLVVNELHNVSLSARAFVVNYGPFFEQGLIVKNGVDGTPLTPNLDYSVAVIYENATLATGKAVFCFIVINNLSLTSVSVTYQTIGGEYAFYTTAMADLLETISLDDRPVEWGSLLGLPSGFTPAPHMHPVTQIYNWGGFIVKLEEIRQAILVGDQAAMEELRSWVSNEVLNAAVPIASNEDAIQGSNLTKRITPSNLKAALDARINALDVATFEFEVDHVDDDWGYWRHKDSGFTMCWGVTNSIASGGAFRAYFRRRFDFKPVITGSSSVITTDATPSGTQWVELTASIAEHTVTNDSFYVAANRINGTGTDGVRFRYIAVGYSGDSQPLATSAGMVATIPPTGATVSTPSWSGAVSVALQTPATGTYRMGIVFPASVVGGGYTFNDVGQTQLAQFFYTLYPGLFDDTLYEIKGSILSTTFAPNVTYTGLTLDTWVDLSAVKAMSSSELTSGFTWTTSGLYGGVVTLEVTIRLKSNTSIFAVRTFTFDRDSTVVIPQFGANPGNAQQSIFYLTSTTGSPVAQTFKILDNSGPTLETTAYPASVLLRDSNSADGNQLASDLSNWYARLVFAPNNGFTLAGSSLAAAGSTSVDTNWYTLTALEAMSNQWATQTTAVDSVMATEMAKVQVRHITDKRKIMTMNYFAMRAGNDTIPVWSGSTGHSVTVPSWDGASAGGFVTFEIVFPLGATPGAGYVKTTRNYSSNTYVSQDNFTYSLGMASINDDDYNVSVYNTILTGATMTASPSVTGGVVSMAGSEVRYVWTGLVQQVTQLHVDITVMHKDYAPAGATASRRFTLNVNLV